MGDIALNDYNIIASSIRRALPRFLQLCHRAKSCLAGPTLASYPGLLRRRDKAMYLLLAHAWVAVEFHRHRLSSYTFAVRDEYSSVLLAVRKALLFTLMTVIVSSFLEALAQ